MSVCAVCLLSAPPVVIISSTRIKHMIKMFLKPASCLLLLFRLHLSLSTPRNVPVLNLGLFELWQSLTFCTEIPSLFHKIQCIYCMFTMQANVVACAHDLTYLKLLLKHQLIALPHPQQNCLISWCNLLRNVIHNIIRSAALPAMIFMIGKNRNALCVGGLWDRKQWDGLVW